MSLILDALRKSAGERQRGQAPTLASAVGLSPRRRVHPARVPMALALLAGTAGAGWWLGFGESPAPGNLADRGEPSEAGGVSPEPATAEDTLAHAPALADAAPALRPEAVQLPLDDVAPQMGEAQSRMAGGVVAGGGGAALPMPAGTVYTPETVTATADSTESTPVAAPSSTPVAPMPPRESTFATPPVSSVDTETRVPPPAASAPAPAPAPVETLLTIDQLDYTIRRELPPLEISMYVYNADPQRRFVIIGGKRYPRTDATGTPITKIEDKVELREIRADGVVLEFNGQRFLLPRGR